MNRRECLMSLTSSASLAMLLLGLPNAISVAAAQASPTWDEARQRQLFALLAVYGRRFTVLPEAYEALGVRTAGKPVPVWQLTNNFGRSRRAFERVEAEPDVFIFSVQDDISNPNSETQMIRVDVRLRRVGLGVRWRNKRAVRMSEAESNASYEFQATGWIKEMER